MLAQEEYVEVHALRKRGWSISAIARHVGRDRKTVRAHLSGERVPGRGKPPTPSDTYGLVEPKRPTAEGTSAADSGTPWSEHDSGPVQVSLVVLSALGLVARTGCAETQREGLNRRVLQYNFEGDALSVRDPHVANEHHPFCV